MTTREAIHAMVDDLPEDRLPEAERMLRQVSTESAGDFRAFLDSLPEDDEPLSEREAEAIRRWQAGDREGRVMTAQQVESYLLSAQSD